MRVGLLGTVIIALGSLTPAYLPQASPVWPVLRAMGLAGQFGRVAGTILAISGVFLLVDAWFRLRRPEYAHLKPLAVVALWSLPFLISSPIFSHDVYSYGAQGWMVHNGQNPYNGGPGLVPGPFTDYTPWVWRYTPAPYGPLALQISRAIVEVSGGIPWLAALLMRIPAILGVIAIVVLLPRVAAAVGADVRQVVWFACLNPLLIIDYVGGAHNDAWMMGVVVVGLWLATRPRWWPVAAVVIGVAASIKQPAILAAPFLPWIAQRFGSWRDPRTTMVALARALAGLVIAAAAFVVISLACGLGFGWIDALGVPNSVPSISPSYVVGTLVQMAVNPAGTFWLALVDRVALGVGVVLVIVGVVRFGPRQPIRALAWAWISVAFTAGALHSWYLLWGGLLLPLTKGKRGVPWVAILVGLLLLCYAGINLGDRNGFFAIIAASVCLLAWLAHLVIYHRLWSAWRGHHSGSPLAAAESEPAVAIGSGRLDG